MVSAWYRPVVKLEVMGEGTTLLFNEPALRDMEIDKTHIVRAWWRESEALGVGSSAPGADIVLVACIASLGGRSLAEMEFVRIASSQTRLAVEWHRPTFFAQR